MYNVIPSKRFSPFGTLKQNQKYYYHEKLKNVGYADPSEPFLEPTDGQQLEHIALALKTAFTNYIMSDAKKTAIGEVIELRRSILKGYELNFNLYKSKVAAGDYS